MSINLIEKLKPCVKTKSNETIYRTIDIIGDKPEYWFDMLSVNKIIFIFKFLTFLDCYFS